MVGIDGERIPLALGFFEIPQLRLNHRVLHVMRLTLRDPLEEGLLVQFEVDEVDLDGRGAVGGHAHDVAVFLFQGRASDDHAGGREIVVGFRGGERLGGRVAKGDEPVPAVCIGERDPATHLLSIRVGVELQSRKASVNLEAPSGWIWEIAGNVHHRPQGRGFGVPAGYPVQRCFSRSQRGL